jgi:predicted nucleic acid-binding protein
MPSKPSLVVNTALTAGLGTVVIDERKGRRWAALHGLRVTGSLGLLLALHRRRLIPSIRVVTDRLLAKGIYLDPALFAAAWEHEAGP